MAVRKQEIKKRFPVFLYLFLSNAVMKTRKDFPGNFARFPLPCVVSSRGRNTPQSWQKPRPLRQRYQQKPTQRVKGISKSPHRGSRHFLRASFYHGAKIRNSAVLPFAGNLLGSAFPKPCYGGLRRKNISDRQAVFLRELPRKYLTDQPIFCDK